MPSYEICPFQLRSSSGADYACLNDFKNILRHEFLPEDPPIGYDEAVQRWQAIPAYIEETTWAAWDASRGRIAAFGETDIYHTGDNEHEMNFRIEVLPELRRHGLARQLLGLVVNQARHHNRRLLITETRGGAPGGEEFLSGMGARRGLPAHLNQLRLAELDNALIQRWLEQSGRLSSEFCLGWWDGLYPEDRVQELSDLMQVLANDQPRDTLELEDMNFTPEIVRQFEKSLLAGGGQRWVLYVTDRERGRIQGLTEVLWPPDRPTILQQGFTGVLPEYRCRGLGRWLKARMIDKVLRERPQVKAIRTGNANSNGPMLKINGELGFKPYFSWCIWQVERGEVEKYLAAHS